MEHLPEFSRSLPAARTNRIVRFPLIVCINKQYQSYSMSVSSSQIYLIFLKFLESNERLKIHFVMILWVVF